MSKLLEIGELLQMGDESNPDEPLNDELMMFYIVASVGLVCMAGLMSGLTIGLLSMDAIDLEVLRRSGTATERKYANAIAPLLRNQHYLLCTLVVWNAASMEALPLFLDRITDPVTAVILSVTVVLLFGEIVPQSICTRYGLAVGYYTSWLMRLLMIIAAPVSWPLGKLLDKILGHGGAVFRRGQLKQFVGLHAEHEGFGGGLTDLEVHVIGSALDLTHKTARQAMTPMSKVYMLPSDRVMDEHCCARVLESGHSRVPVHAPGDRDDIVGIILVKELLLKSRDPVPVSQLKMRSMPRLSANMPMYDVLQLFKTGRAHMALLCEASEESKEQARKRMRSSALSSTSNLRSVFDHPVHSALAANGSASTPLLASDAGTIPHGNVHAIGGSTHGRMQMSDAYLDMTEGKPIGIITIEDVIEELIGGEIVDETDRFVDNLQTARVNASMLAGELPANLRTVLAMGLFTPRVGPLGGTTLGRTYRKARSEINAEDAANAQTLDAHGLMQAAQQVEEYLNADPSVRDAVESLRSAVRKPLITTRLSSVALSAGASGNSFFAATGGRDDVGEGQ